MTKFLLTLALLGAAVVGTNAVCADCAANTLTCTATAALTCAEGYVLNDATPKVCLQCSANTTTCTGVGATNAATTVSTACADAYYVSADTPAVCSACADANTLTCTSATVGLTCAAGYVLNDATPKVCIQCSANTTTCTGVGATNAATTVSTACDAQVVLAAAVLDSCMATVTSAVAATAPGYFVAGTTPATCVQCSALTSTCTSAGAGTTVLSVSDTCFDSATAASALNNATTAKCIACDTFANGTLTCDAGATNADDTAGTISTDCMPGFYKNSASPVRCVACAANTLTCTSTAALTCAAGWAKNGDTAAVCVECSANTTDCTAAATVTTPAATVSTACRAGAEATVDADGDAVAAVLGAIINTATVVGCTECSANTETCTVGADNLTATTVSTACHDGFKLSALTPVTCIAECAAGNTWAATPVCTAQGVEAQTCIHADNQIGVVAVTGQSGTRAAAFSCTATLCLADENVVSNVCTACAGALVNDAGDDASGDDTDCDAAPTTAAPSTGLSGAASVHASSALVAGLLVALGFAQ